ncbi:MAG: HAD-IA family hydrolase [Syntrophobacterales bacterium]|nr:HAD-IA family hydrolase [Syntrophobacterales bacterium]
MTAVKLPIQAVIFDFDGTLAEIRIDFAAMRKTVLHVMERHNVPAHPFAKLYILEMVKAAGEYLRAVSPGASRAFVSEAMQEIEKIETSAAKGAKLFAGVKPMLTVLAAVPVATGIITRNCFPALHAIFPDYKDYINALISREMTDFVKPDPRHLQEILALLGVSPQRVLMVGDHHIDVQIGKEVGTYTAAVLTGTGKEDVLKEASPDFILSQVVDILEIPGIKNPP